MRLIHCTQKLLKELGNPPLETPAPETPTSLGNWYANLLRIDRRKCLLFTNEKTLYSFLIPKVLKENLKNLQDEFLINLNLNLQAEGFSIEVINSVMQEYGEIGFAKTANKRVLGSMNEFAFEYDFIIKREGGLNNVNSLGVNKQINRTPMSPLKYGYPVDGLKNLLVGS
jgi:hypothetical protein